MIAIDGIWYDGKTSAQVKAVCLPGSAATVRSALEAVTGVVETMSVGLGRDARLVG